ncbi:hypothetical protein [Tenuibacillus multivorans]|uniref:TrbC/VIRB2 family protein n=1 Tax=Tenuibacillus multivorans TaxID=237069 RepID=A0A1H0CGC1_9BACI|nr:hypothetical protein [Tenuibacillus multivorans]GEL76306.1 hypothetical protein TMU01_05410 [Tenuibacillus multivorans]SDN56927.1 hypothetical protein SAMN05216498_2528 [Tenuibacillus multivorans]
MKTQAYDFKAFISNELLDDIKPPTASILPLAAAPLWTSMAVSAETTIQTKMITAFTPLIDLIQGMAYPVAMVVVLGGALFVMIGNSEKGFSMMQKAGLGYVIVMLAPMILNVLVDAMEGVA